MPEYVQVQASNWQLFYDALQVNCSCAYEVLIGKNMSITFVSKQWETTMTS